MMHRPPSVFIQTLRFKDRPVLPSLALVFSTSCSSRLWLSLTSHALYCLVQGDIKITNRHVSIALLPLRQEEEARKGDSEGRTIFERDVETHLLVSADHDQPRKASRTCWRLAP